MAERVFEPWSLEGRKGVVLPDRAARPNKKIHESRGHSSLFYFFFC